MTVSATGPPAAPSPVGWLVPVTWLVVAAGVALRAWVTVAGYFYWDDYILQGRAWRLPFGAELLLYDHDGHLMPAAMALQWVVTALAPGQYAWPVAIMIALQAAILSAAAGLLLTEFRRTWALLLPLGILALSPLTLPAGTWWSSALNALPLQLAFVLAVWAFLRWQRTGSRWAAVLSLVAWVLGLPFFEKSLLIPIALLGLCFVLDTSRSAWRAVVWHLRTHWLYWGTTLVLMVAYFIGNRLLIETALPPDRNWSLVADFVGLSGAAAITALLGGPWHWIPVGYGSAIGDAPPWLGWVAAEVAFVVMVGTSLLRPRAWRAWAWAWAYLALGVAVIALARISSDVSPGITQGLRYVADSSIAFIFALAFALLPLRRQSPTLEGATEGTAHHLPRWTLVPVVALGVVIAAGSLFSTMTFREVWAANPSRDYVTHAAPSLAAASDPVIDQPVPSFVLYGLAAPYNSLSWLMPPFADGYTAGEQTTELAVMDDSGSLVPAWVVGPESVPGPESSCGWRLSSGQELAIPLDAYVIPFKHLIRLGYLATAATPARIRLGDGPPVDVSLQPGVHAAYAWIDGGGTTVHLELGADGVDGVEVCTDEITVGAMAPAEGSP